MSPLRRLFLASATAVLLAACASTPDQATVQVFTNPLQLPAGMTYRFERLPSQNAQPRQAELEAAADAALARAGLRRNDAAARLSVQVSASQDVAPAWGGYGGPQVGIGLGGGGGGGSVGIGLGFPLGGGGFGSQGNQRVDVQLRDVGTGQLVFQSQASASAGASPAALVEAALRDFPAVGAGTRQVPLAVAAPAR